jgi:hypothetical protein
MSIAAVVLEGLRQAAAHAAMLFSLGTPAPPVQAPPPDVVPKPAALPADGSLAATGLTLLAHHADVHVDGRTASARVQMLLRNDTAQAVSVQYLLPGRARLARGDPLRRLAGVADDADLQPLEAERIEAEPVRALHARDVVVVAPGEQVGIEVEREVVVRAAGRMRRLRLPLPFDPAAPWVPRFSADVLVQAGRPVRSLASPSHPVLVDGLGEPVAMLSVVDGLVHRAAALEVEFEIDADAPPAAALALGRGAAVRDR